MPVAVVGVLLGLEGGRRIGDRARQDVQTIAFGHGEQAAHRSDGQGGKRRRVHTGSIDDLAVGLAHPTHEMVSGCSNCGCAVSDELGRGSIAIAGDGRYGFGADGDSAAARAVKHDDLSALKHEVAVLVALHIARLVLQLDVDLAPAGIEADRDFIRIAIAVDGLGDFCEGLTLGRKLRGPTVGGVVPTVQLVEAGQVTVLVVDQVTARFHDDANVGRLKIGRSPGDVVLGRRGTGRGRNELAIDVTRTLGCGSVVGGVVVVIDNPVVALLGPGSEQRHGASIGQRGEALVSIDRAVDGFGDLGEGHGTVEVMSAAVGGNVVPVVQTEARLGPLRIHRLKARGQALPCRRFSRLGRSGASRVGDQVSTSRIGHSAPNGCLDTVGIISHDVVGHCLVEQLHMEQAICQL